MKNPLIINGLSLLA